MKVFFVGASPKGTPRLEVEQARGVVHGAVGPLLGAPALEPDAFGAALEAARPEVLHVVAHGDGEVLQLADGENVKRPLSAADFLAGLERAPSLRLVVLTACHSEDLAARAAERVGCAIGMRSLAQDSANRVFSGALYHALAAGQSVAEAFDHAADAVGRREAEHKPVLFGDRTVAFGGASREGRPLTQEERHAVVDAATETGLLEKIGLLRGALPARLRGQIPEPEASFDAMSYLVLRTNEWHRVRVDGRPPLAVVLRAAEQHAGFLPEADVFTRMREIVEGI